MRRIGNTGKGVIFLMIASLLLFPHTSVADSDPSASKSQGNLADFRNTFNALAVQFGEDIKYIKELDKIEVEYTELELEMRLHIAAIQRAERKAESGNEILPYVVHPLVKLAELHREALELIKTLQGKPAELAKAYQIYTNASKPASEAAGKVCSYAALISSDPLPSVEALIRWKEESLRMVAKAATIENAHSEAESLKKLLKSLDSEISRLELSIEYLNNFDRNKFLAAVNQFKQVKTELLNAEKTLPRIKELRNTLETLAGLSNDMVQKLLVSMWAKKMKVKALAEDASGRDEKLQADLAGLQDQIMTAYNQLNQKGLINGSEMPEVPDLSPGLSGLRDKLKNIDDSKPNELIGQLESVIADGRKIISDYETVLLAGLDTKHAPEETRRAMDCLASIENAIEETTGDSGGDKDGKIDPELTAILQQIVKVSQEADSLWKHHQNQTLVKIAVSMEICEEAGLFRNELPANADGFIRASDVVKRSLSGATTLAEKCPDVANPEKIHKLYNLSKKFTGQIGNDVDILKQKNAALTDKLSLAAIARADAMQEAKTIKAGVAEKYARIKALKISSTNREQELKNTLDKDPYLLVPPNLITESVKTTEKMEFLTRETSSLLNEAKSNPQCAVQPGDDIVAIAENAYKSALNSLRSAKNLPGKAETCLANTTEKEEPPETAESTDSDQVVTLPNVVGMSLLEAVDVLKAVGLFALPEVGSSALKPDDVGKVEVAFPAKDGEVHAGDQVIVRVFDEAVESGKVPSIIGMEMTKAADAVKAAGFNPAFELGEETSDPQKEGIVASQAPASGVEIESGKEVRIILYTLAIDTRTVPNLKGMGLKAAQQALKANGLFINPFLEKDAPKKFDEGKVYKQYPEPGFEIMAGVGVDVWVYGDYEAPEDEPGASQQVVTKTMSGGIPSFNIHAIPGYGYYPNTWTSCDGFVNYERGTKFVRIQRSQYGFLCENASEKSRILRLNFMNKKFNGGARIKVAWYEPGDNRGDYRVGDGKISYSRGKETSVDSTKSDMAWMSSKSSCAWVQITADLKYGISEYDAKRILSKYVNELMSQVEPYAAKCR